MQHMTHMTVCMSKLQVQPAMNLQTVEKTIKVKQRTSPHNVRCTCTLTINVRQTTNRQLQGTRLFQRRPKHFKQIGLQCMAMAMESAQCQFKKLYWHCTYPQINKVKQLREIERVVRGYVSVEENCLNLSGACSFLIANATCSRGHSYQLLGN